MVPLHQGKRPPGTHPTRKKAYSFSKPHGNNETAYSLGLWHDTFIVSSNKSFGKTKYIKTALNQNTLKN
jgi:hypothetical protein